MPSKQFDADHPAFLVMDEDHDAWVHQLERIHPCFKEQEREAFRRARFRREWMSLGYAFDIVRFFESGFPWAVPANAAEWMFLLRAWMAQCKPSILVRSVRPDLAISAMRFATTELNSEMLNALREQDKTLYVEFGLDLWRAISARCAFADRFHYHPGGCGQHQARKNVDIANFDRFLRMWPVDTDAALRVVAREIERWRSVKPAGERSQ